jgi:hypothetical protein
MDGWMSFALAFQNNEMSRLNITSLLRRKSAYCQSGGCSDLEGIYSAIQRD